MNSYGSNHDDSSHDMNSANNNRIYDDCSSYSYNNKDRSSSCLSMNYISSLYCYKNSHTLNNENNNNYLYIDLQLWMSQPGHEWIDFLPDICNQEEE